MFSVRTTLLVTVDGLSCESWSVLLQALEQGIIPLVFLQLQTNSYFTTQRLIPKGISPPTLRSRAILYGLNSLKLTHRFTFISAEDGNGKQPQHR